MENFNITAKVQTILGSTEIQFESKECFGSNSGLFTVEVSFPKVNQKDSEKIAFDMGLQKLEQKRLKGLSVFNLFTNPQNQTNCLERILQLIKSSKEKHKNQEQNQEATINSVKNYATNDGIAGLA